MIFSPDNCFDILFHLSRRLPEIARVRPTQLCSEYFTSLSKELVYQIITRSFQMPLFVNLNTKSKQLSTLQEARESDSTDYK